MSVDLTLLPFDGDLSDLSFSHTVLNVYSNYDLHDQINKLSQLDVPDGFNSYMSRNDKPDDYYFGESCYGKTIEDCYGKHVKYTTVKELLTIKEKYWTARSVPVYAYLKALDPQTKVALYWH
jgi:hypothetical protein